MDQVHLSALGARQRDPYGVTEQRVRHAAGISLGNAAEQRDPSRVTEQRVRHAVGISLDSGWQLA